MVSPNAMKLKLPASYKIHDVINVSRLRLYKEPTAGQRITPMEPVEVEGQPEYEVDNLLHPPLLDPLPRRAQPPWYSLSSLSSPPLTIALSDPL